MYECVYHCITGTSCCTVHVVLPSQPCHADSASGEWVMSTPCYGEQWYVQPGVPSCLHYFLVHISVTVGQRTLGESPALSCTNIDDLDLVR